MKHLNQILATNSNCHPQDVLAAKTFLQDQGFYEAPEWGLSEFPDRALFNAIKAFQKSQGLKVDGVMKPEGETEAATQSIQATALELQNMGRDGDTILAHITPAEARLLKQTGGSGTINPKTGLLEFKRVHANNYSRDKAEKAEAQAGAAARAAVGRQKSGDFDKKLGRSLGYNDFAPGGIHGNKNRNGTLKTGRDLAVHNRAVAREKAAKEATQRQAEQQARAKKQAEDQHQQEQERQADEERRARQYASMPDMTDPDENQGVLSKSKPKNHNANEGVNVSDEEATAQINAQNAREEAEKQVKQDKEDQRALDKRNRDQARYIKQRADEQRLNDQITVEREKAAKRAPGKVFSDAQLRGAAQANLSIAKTSKKTNDIIAQSRANVAKAIKQGETLTQAQSLGREIDKLRTKNTQQAEQNRTAPQGISDKALSDVIQGLNKSVKSIDPNARFSYNALAEAARNILSGNGKTSAVQDYLGGNTSGQAKSEWQKSVEAITGYTLTQADGWNPFSNPEREKQKKEIERYMRSHGHKGYVYGGNNLGIPSNNTYGVDGSRRALGDAVEAEAATKAGQALSIGSNVVKAPAASKAMSITGTLLENHGKKKRANLLDPEYRP